MRTDQTSSSWLIHLNCKDGWKGFSAHKRYALRALCLTEFSRERYACQNDGKVIDFIAAHRPSPPPCLRRLPGGRGAQRQSDPAVFLGTTYPISSRPA